MPTVLTLYYTAHVNVTVPNAIARKLKLQEGVQIYGDEPWTFCNKWGNIIYTDDEGKTHTIKGEEGETDYKRTEEGEWNAEDESEAEDEEESESETETKTVSESESKTEE